MRAGRLAGGHELITAIEGDLEQYHRAPVTQVPPPQLAEVLPLMGWLIHEAAASTTDYAKLPIEDSAGNPLEPSAGLRAAIAWIRRHSTTS